VLQRRFRGRIEFTNGDRLFFIMLYRMFPSVVKAITIIRPETLVRWHRAGFRRYWRWKSRDPGGRPPLRAELRVLIRRLSIENVLWGAPRIQGELLNLGFTVAQSTVAKYMAQNGNPSGQTWNTFLRNHAPHIAAMDLLVVSTIGFVQLYVPVIVRLARRELVWINVTRQPTADWIARQITEAFPWNDAPRYLIRDQDAIYGVVVSYSDVLARSHANDFRLVVNHPIYQASFPAMRLERDTDREITTTKRGKRIATSIDGTLTRARSWCPRPYPRALAPLLLA
jgi:hypothetical protein